MSTSRYSTSKISSQSNDHLLDIDDRYVKKQCSHDSCDKSDGTAPQNIEYSEDAVDIEEQQNPLSVDGSFNLSSFTEAECGEPMHRQFLRIDFTPIEGVDDNPHMLKKCSDFWEFLNRQTELQGLVVYPEKGYEEIISVGSKEPSLKQNENVPTPAADWLETGVGQKMAFAAEQQIKYCPQQNGDYVEESRAKNASATRPRTKNERKTLEPSVSDRPVTETRRSTSNAIDLCKQLEKWDRQHPKSMNPPGQVPNLTHAILQRTTQEC